MASGATNYDIGATLWQTQSSCQITMMAREQGSNEQATFEAIKKKARIRMDYDHFGSFFPPCGNK